MNGLQLGRAVVALVALRAAISMSVAQQPGTAPAPSPVTGIAIGSDGSSVNCSPAGITFTTPSRTRQIAAPNGRAFVAAALKDGGFLVGGGEPAQSGWLWRYDTGMDLQATRQVGGDVVEALAVTADGELVAAGLATGQVMLWSVTTDRPARELARHQGSCRAVAFAERDRVLLSGGRDGRLLHIDLATGAIRENADHTAGIDCVAVGGDGRVASGALDGRLRLHDRDGRLLRTWQRLGGRVQALAPDDTAWIVGLDSGRLLRLRDTHDEPELLRDLQHPIHVLAWATDALWIGQQSGLVLWQPTAQRR